MKEKLTEFLETIDQSSLMKEYLACKKEVLARKDLCCKIETYHVTKDWDLRKEIMMDPTFLRYQSLENELYYLTLEITKRLKSLTRGDQ